MRAFILSKYATALREADMPEPVVGDRDVLVRIQAAGLNQLDEKIRAGEFKQILPYRLPQTLGSDVAGTVIGVGSAVRAFAVGDEVYARTSRPGTFAERVAVAEADLALKPASIGMAEAGSLPLVALTAWQALVEVGNVQPGQRVLIHAGAGGVGSIAIQLARHLGASVATTVSPSNADFVRELGAETVIDYRTQDFERVLSGYDLVLDSVGGENLERSLRILRPGGIAIGIARAPRPRLRGSRRPEPGAAPRHRCAQRAGAPAGQAARGAVRVPLHALQRRSAARDHRPGRVRRAAARRGRHRAVRPGRDGARGARAGRQPRQGGDGQPVGLLGASVRVCASPVAVQLERSFSASTVGEPGGAL